MSVLEIKRQVLYYATECHARVVLLDSSGNLLNPMAGCKHSKYPIGLVSKQRTRMIQHPQKKIIHSRKIFLMLILTESGTDTGLYNASASLLVPLSSAQEQRFNTVTQIHGIKQEGEAISNEIRV